MSFSFRNESTGLYIYTVTVDFVHENMDTDILYYGGNLEISRRYIPNDSVDLICLDPPFNGKATYNVLCKEQTGEPSQAQITAFEDTWHWGLESEKALQEMLESPIAPSARCLCLLFEVV